VATPNLPVALNVVTNVSSLVSVSITGPVQAPTAAVTNIGGSPIPGPLSLGLFVDCGVGCSQSLQLVNQTGTYNGDPYITISAGPLNPGQTASTVLQFVTPSKFPVNTVVYSGNMPPGQLSLTCPTNTAQ